MACKNCSKEGICRLHEVQTDVCVSEDGFCLIQLGDDCADKEDCLWREEKR